MTCDGLPNPGSLSEMNSFVFLWSMEDKEVNMSNFTKKYDIIVYVHKSLCNCVDFLNAIIRWPVKTRIAND